ncbi:Predicted cell-wall-anchored protein SasA (LPXTG motif) [Leuconostoc pseudomesenteroides 4882]|nr:Predicted cell-wall-anchored protein SasA (LPXTG motif) [Leuconostoc pseudomesenteroides 4882]
MSQAQTETLTSLKALRDELLAQNTQSLLDMHQKLEEDISNKRSQYQSEHEKAMISATELESAKTHSGSLSELEQQVQILKQTNLNLEQQLKGKDAVNIDEVSQLRQQLQMLQNAPKTTSHDETNQQLMTLLAAQIQQPQVEQKKTSAWQSSAIGFLAVLAIGGAGFGGYAMAQHKTDATAQSSKAVSASGHNEGNATVTLAPESSEAGSSSNVSASSSQSSSSSSQANTSSTLADRYHVGEDVDATINGQTVTAKVVSVQDKTITVHHDGYDYVVPFDN